MITMNLNPDAYAYVAEAIVCMAYGDEQAADRALFMAELISPDARWLDGLVHSVAMGIQELEAECDQQSREIRRLEARVDELLDEIKEWERRWEKAEALFAQMEKQQ